MILVGNEGYSSRIGSQSHIKAELRSQALVIFSKRMINWQDCFTVIPNVVSTRHKSTLLLLSDRENDSL